MKSRILFKLGVIPLIGFLLISSFSASASTSVKNKVQQDVIINFVGDVHGERAINRSAIASLKKFFQYSDLNVFNLETAITNHNVKEEKAYNFRTNLSFLSSLKGAGLNLANVANNHTYDFGEIGFLDTLSNLEKAGIPYVGGGLNSSSAYQGRVVEIKGLRIGILGFAKVNGGPLSIAGKNKPGMTNGYDATATTQAIRNLKASSDILIIVAHWGEEGSPCPRGTEISSARRWLAQGADIIVGSHTHTIQPIEFKENRLVAYSMGNFIFYSSKIENRSTGILTIRISPEKKISYIFKPFLINNLTKVPEFTLSAPTAAIDCKNYAKTTVR